MSTNEPNPRRGSLRRGLRAAALLGCAFALTRAGGTAWGASALAAADLNGDAKPDLAVADRGGGVSVLLNACLP